jgi:hypothetical protein
LSRPRDAPIAAASMRSSCTWHTAICCTNSCRRSRTEAKRRVRRQLCEPHPPAARSLRCGARADLVRRPARLACASTANRLGGRRHGRSTSRLNWRVS